MTLSDSAQWCVVAIATHSAATSMLLMLRCCAAAP